MFYRQHSEFTLELWCKLCVSHSARPSVQSSHTTERQTETPIRPHCAARHSASDRNACYCSAVLWAISRRPAASARQITKVVYGFAEKLPPLFVHLAFYCLFHCLLLSSSSVEGFTTSTQHTRSPHILASLDE